MAKRDDIAGVEARTSGALRGAAELGRGPTPKGDFSRHDYHHAAAGWGAARSVGAVLEQAGTPIEGVHAMSVMNQPDGFDCPGCAWPDDPPSARDHPILVMRAPWGRARLPSRP
jgi:hypothetical protein